MASEKYTILYGRLSQEDLQKGKRQDDSNSIQNQRLLLEKYAAEKGFTNTKFIYDDGYSGTNFNRPGWQEVLSLIEAGQVGTLIVKDMSRLGREYLQVGQYTELLFPSNGIRFIAVNDGVDSLYESTNDFTPFRNIMNEFYAKDCSKKMRSAVRVKAETGARVGSRPPFGYRKDPADPKRHIVPDEDTAPIVQYIFRLCMEGNGPAQIAKRLKQEKIPNPSVFYYRKYGCLPSGGDISDPYFWKHATVAGILENEVYLGHTVNLKATTISYKNKTKVVHPESERLRFENTHEALVDQQTWDIVQEVRSHKRRRNNFDEQNMFSGLVYCADCGSVMTIMRSRSRGPRITQFMCSTYRNKGKEACSVHTIRETVLKSVLLDDIRRVTHFARQNERLFAQFIGQKQGIDTHKEILQLEKQLEDLRKRQGVLKMLFKKLYEDSVLEKIPQEQYRMLSEEYIGEQNQISQQIPELEARLNALKESSAGVGKFLERARKYTQITELTPEILWTFVQRIEVSERAEKRKQKAAQEIRIYYRDIGLLDDEPILAPSARTTA